jgi:hypothetical protein
MINPYHVQPGLLLDVDITSLKRKKVTLNGMANVLNEFLHGVSKGFQDAAFASFSRRRSTVRDDIAQSFATDTGASAAPVQAAQAPAQAYLDMLNADDENTALAPVKASAGSRRGGGSKTAAKAASAKPKRGGSRPTRSGGRGGIRQI